MSVGDNGEVVGIVRFMQIMTMYTNIRQSLECCVSAAQAGTEGCGTRGQGISSQGVKLRLSSGP